MPDWLAILKERIGWEGATSLADKLTLARAAFLDAAISGRAVPGDQMALLAATIVLIRQSVCAAGDPAGSIGKLLNDYLDVAISSRAPGATALSTAIWTPARAALLDEITVARGLLLDRLSIITAGGAGELTAARAAALQRLIDDLTAARCGYLNNINNANLSTIPDISTLSAVRIGYLDQLDFDLQAAIGAIPTTAMRGTDNAATVADGWDAALATILDNFTAARIGYLNNINNANLSTIPNISTLSAARIGYLNNLSGGAVALAASWTAALATALGNYTAARAGYLDNINQAGLLQVTAARAALLDQITAARLGELDAANLPADINTLLVRLPAVLSAARIGYLDNINNVQLLNITAARIGYIDTLNTGVLIDSRTTAASRLAGVTQIFTKNITSAANIGDVTVATITTQPCFIKRIVLRANNATTANLTNAAIYGGAGKVVTFIDSVTGIRANIAAADQQVAWGGAASFAATKTIVITLTGTGAAAVNLQVDIEFEAIADGGYLV